MDKIDDLQYYTTVLRLVEQEYDALRGSLKEMNKRKDVHIDIHEKYLNDVSIMSAAIVKTKNILKGIS